VDVTRREAVLIENAGNRELRIILARNKKDEISGWSRFGNEELLNFCSYLADVRVIKFRII
jgi:hypothetical protein